MSTSPVHRFTELLRKNPELTESQLLNANNQTPFTGRADVVVAGAGILGLCYAIHLKNVSPQLRIEVFEKSHAPIQKIGESTLSPFSTFTTGDILPYDYLLRLFGLKDGIQFYSVDQKGAAITENSIGGLDVSFQLDRRVSELFFTMWAQQLGVNVYHGVMIDFDIPEAGSIMSDLSLEELSNPTNIPVKPFRTPKVLLKDLNHVLPSTVDTRLVCDASGFSRRLTSKFGARERFDGWNTDAYWTYFREKDLSNVDERLIGWNYPATKHICFPEGWGWFIGLISWHHAPLANLMDLCAHIISEARAGVKPDDFISTRGLSKMFDCPYEFITSIGWAVRNDFKLPADLSEYGTGEGEQKFNFFKKRYPTIDTLLTDQYEVLPSYYEARTYFVKKGLTYRSPVCAGEGWLALGNTAGFTNPLISPGINAGLGGAWHAAHMTSKVFAAPPHEAKSAMTHAAKTHQEFMHDYAVPRLYAMNLLWYNSFRDHRLFDVIPPALWSCSFDAVDNHYYDNEHERQLYTETDARWMLGTGFEEFQQLAREVLAVIDGPNGGAPPSEEQIEEVVAICKRTIKERTEKFPENSWSQWMRCLDDKLERVPGKHFRSEGFLIEAKRCDDCKYFVHNHANTCPICGKRDVWERASAAMGAAM
ncbi:hypothetical protein DFH06DRAFT_624907 [Mycena polygramma]|nr:hypothetical protein DFH06DRAFT_624907 [Mycena polygramma]